MRKLFVILSILLINGCVYQSIDSNEIRLANEFCKINSGLYKITEKFTGDTLVRCNNGKAKYVP